MIATILNQLLPILLCLFDWHLPLRCTNVRCVLSAVKRAFIWCPEIKSISCFDAQIQGFARDQTEFLLLLLNYSSLLHEFLTPWQIGHCYQSKQDYIDDVPAMQRERSTNILKPCRQGWSRQPAPKPQKARFEKFSILRILPQIIFVVSVLLAFVFLNFFS
jgi:hypothetical protein